MIRFINRITKRISTSNSPVVITVAAIGLGVAVVGGIVYYMLRGAGRLAITAVDRKMLVSSDERAT